MRLAASCASCAFLAFTALMLPARCYAQTAVDPLGLTAGAIVLRGRIVAILPDNSNSTITRIGGHIAVSDSVTPEFDLSYFLTNHIAIEAETGFTHNTLTAEDTALGDVSVGKVWAAPLLLIMQYHLLPYSRWNPYAGVGLSIQPYFGVQPAGGTVHQLAIRSQVGAAFQAGLDYRISDHWYGNLDVKKILINSSSSVNDDELSEQRQT